MPNATVIIAEEITLTNDGGGQTTKVTIPAGSFEPSTKYFVYATAGFSDDNQFGKVDYGVFYGGDGVFTGRMEPGTGADQVSQMAWFDVYDQPASPTDITIEFAPVDCVATAGHAQIIVIKLTDDFVEGTDWKFGANTSVTQHTTALVEFASVTLDGADGAKDWLIFAMEEVVVDSVSVNYEADIFDGTNGFMSQSIEGGDLGEVQTFVLCRTFDAVALNTVFTLRARDDATGINDHRKSKVFALNLNAFRNHKSSYTTSDVALGSGMTEIGNLNNGGNYTPFRTGHQLIFTNWINDTATISKWNDQLQVNGVTTPTSWSYEQGVWIGIEARDNTDLVSNVIATKVNIPSTGQAIDLDAKEVSGSSQVADEISMTVFSVELASVPTNQDEVAAACYVN